MHPIPSSTVKLLALLTGSTILGTVTWSILESGVTTTISIGNIMSATAFLVGAAMAYRGIRDELVDIKEWIEVHNQLTNKHIESMERMSTTTASLLEIGRSNQERIHRLERSEDDRRNRRRDD